MFHFLNKIAFRCLFSKNSFGSINKEIIVHNFLNHCIAFVSKHMLLGYEYVIIHLKQ